MWEALGAWPSWFLQPVLRFGVALIVSLGMGLGGTWTAEWLLRRVGGWAVWLAASVWSALWAVGAWCGGLLWRWGRVLVYLTATAVLFAHVFPHMLAQPDLLDSISEAVRVGVATASPTLSTIREAWGVVWSRVTPYVIRVWTWLSTLYYAAASTPPSLRAPLNEEDPVWLEAVERARNAQRP